MSNPIERYQELDVRDSLARSYRYPFACKELSFIIRAAFNKFPKILQALIYQDLITAFNLLPQMQTTSAVSAAHLLVQGVEAALPKQKRNAAIVEFKQAMVAHKRRNKARREEKGSAALPHDVLLHIFSLLDIQSLVSVGLVCGSWYEAADDDYLWQLQYATVFGDSINGGKLNKDEGSVEDLASKTRVDWKAAFKRAYIGYSSRRKTYERGYCKHCEKIVSMSNMRCPNCHGSCKNKQIKPFSQNQVVEYLLNGSSKLFSSSDSDSDSDSDEVVISEFWGFPKYLSC